MIDTLPINALDGYDFGACECGRPGDHMFNVPVPEGADHYMACEVCKTRWRIGTNLFTGWMYVEAEENPEWWEAAAAGLVRIPFLDEYREVPGDLPPLALEAIHREAERGIQRG